MKNNLYSFLTIGLIVFGVSAESAESAESPLVISTRETLKTWTKSREYANKWNLKQHNLPSQEKQNAYAQKQFRRYLERQIKNKLERPVKRREYAGRFPEQKTLDSKLNMSFFDDFEFRFKTRVLQGKAFMVLKNPYLDFITTASASRGIDMKLGKSIDEIGVQTHLSYTSKGHWNANINKSITGTINAQVSRISGNAISDETTVQLLYEKMF